MSWMSMNRIGQYPGRGSEREERDRKNPVNVTAAEASQTITPVARTQGVNPNDITMTPAIVDSQPEVPKSEGPDGHPPVCVVSQLRRLLHVGNYSTVDRSLSRRAGTAESAPLSRCHLRPEPCLLALVNRGTSLGRVTR